MMANLSITSLKYCKDSKALIEYSNYVNDIYRSIEEYNTNRKHKILIVLDDMIANMISNEKLNSAVTKLFVRGRKLNMSLVFITQSYFAVPKNIRLSSTHFFIMKIPNKRKLQQNAFNHSSNIDIPGLMNLNKMLEKKQTKIKMSKNLFWMKQKGKK